MSDRQRYEEIMRQIERGNSYRGRSYSSSSIASSFSTVKGAADTLSRGVFYLAVGALILFVSLVFINYTTYPIFSFSAGSDGIVSMPLPSSVQTMNASTIPPYDTPLKFNAMVAYGYSLSVDVYLQSEFAINDTYPRVVLYRAATPINALAFPSSGTLSSLQDLIPNSNIIVYIDPLVNNLYVMIQTGDGTSQTTNAITNIPIRSPFRMTIVLDSSFVEVYIDGKMEQTMPLKNAPIATDPTNAFYGPPQLVASAMKITNVNYYSMLLSPKTIRVLATQPAINTTIFTASS